MGKISYLTSRLVCLVFNCFVLGINCSWRLIAKARGFFGFIYLKNEGSLSIGRNVTIISAFRFNPIGYMKRTAITIKNNAVLTICDGVGISNSVIFCSKEIYIGENVYIGGDCRIYDTDFHSLKYEKRISDNDDDVATKAVRICRGAFIGAGCIILKGVTIGERAVVGAGSVISKDIPSNQIWAGNPVRYIRDI